MTINRIVFCSIFLLSVNISALEIDQELHKTVCTHDILQLDKIKSKHYVENKIALRRERVKRGAVESAVGLGLYIAGIYVPRGKKTNKEFLCSLAMITGIISLGFGLHDIVKNLHEIYLLQKAHAPCEKSLS